MSTKLDFSELTDIEVEGIDTSDAPDFCDAFISYARLGGKDCTDEQLDEINDDRDFVYAQVERKLY